MFYENLIQILDKLLVNGLFFFNYKQIIRYKNAKYNEINSFTNIGQYIMINCQWYYFFIRKFLLIRIDR